MITLHALRFFSSRANQNATARQPLLGPTDGWCNPGLFPGAFLPDRRIRADYYKNMAAFYPFIDFTGLPLNNRFDLPENSVLQKIILCETGLTSLDEFGVLGNCDNLEHLDLSFNAIGHTDAMLQLASICRARQKTLRELVLEGVNISRAKATIFKQLIPQGAVLDHLCLTSAHITDSQARSLARAVQRKSHPLSTLSLSSNPDISPAVLIDILNAMAARPGASDIDFNHCARFEACHEDDVLEAVFNMNDLKKFTLPTGSTPLIALGVKDKLAKNRAWKMERQIIDEWSEQRTRLCVADDPTYTEPAGIRL